MQVVKRIHVIITNTIHVYCLVIENKLQCSYLKCSVHFICVGELIIITIINFRYNQVMSILQED